MLDLDFQKICLFLKSENPALAFLFIYVVGCRDERAPVPGTLLPESRYNLLSDLGGPLQGNPVVEPYLEVWRMQCFEDEVILWAHKSKKDCKDFSCYIPRINTFLLPFLDIVILRHENIIFYIYRQHSWFSCHLYVHFLKIM